MRQTAWKCKCGKPANYRVGKRDMCVACLVAERGLCAICANDCKDCDMAVDLCSDFAAMDATAKAYADQNISN